MLAFIQNKTMRKFVSLVGIVTTSIISQNNRCICCPTNSIEIKKHKLVQDVNNISDDTVLDRVQDSVQLLIEHDRLMKSNIQKNYKTFFCSRNNVPYDTIKCMTINELNKKEQYEKSTNLYEIAIYNSRYSDKKYDYNFTKIRPYDNNCRHVNYIADAIMFNKNFNIEKMQDVYHYLTMCKYSYNRDEDSVNVDGWNVKYNDFNKDLNYKINFNINNMKNSSFPNNSGDVRNVLRALIIIMNETPIEHVNMNNYIMLGQYDQNHDLFLQSGDIMNYIEKKK